LFNPTLRRHPIATVLGLCPFLPLLLGRQGGGSWYTALITALMKRVVKLRFTWFATVGFIRCFAHPILRKTELHFSNYLFRDEAISKDMFLKKRTFSKYNLGRTEYVKMSAMREIF